MLAAPEKDHKKIVGASRGHTVIRPLFKSLHTKTYELNRCVKKSHNLCKILYKFGKIHVVYFFVTQRLLFSFVACKLLKQCLQFSAFGGGFEYRKLLIFVTPQGC